MQFETEARRGPGRPPKAEPAASTAPASPDVAAILATEREKIMAQARAEVEAAHAEAVAKTKAEAERLVKEALAEEAKQRADDAEILRLARAAQDLVECRVLPMGDKRIHTGELSDVDQKPLKFARGDKFWIARSIAVAQEAAGRVEIL